MKRRFSKRKKQKDSMSSSADTPSPQIEGNIKRTRSKMGLVGRLRNYFFTGLIIVGPVIITIQFLLFFINYIDSWIKPYLPSFYNPETYLPFSIPGIGVLVFIAGLMLIGALTANLFGRTLLNYGESLLNRTPVVRNFYSALKQIFETVLSQSNSSFQNVGLIEYPRKGLYAIVFIATDTKGEIKEKIDHSGELLSVFLPTTPNPTSGYLLFVPKKDVQLLDMTVEEGAKLVISAGLVTPEKADEEEDSQKMDAELETNLAHGETTGQTETK